jgi:hypothetical protein
VKKSELNAILLDFQKCQYVGSRVTCNPPPQDTDCDILCLMSPDDDINQLTSRLFEFGFTLDGSDVSAERYDVYNKHQTDIGVFEKKFTRVFLNPPPQQFWSFSIQIIDSDKTDEYNLIITPDKDFYQKFILGTNLARYLNLLKKIDRVALFQAVLYGNDATGYDCKVVDIVPQI